MASNKGDIVILDCYTDEPSGYGVRPYLGTHQIHLSQVLAFQGIDHFYLTIDDLRYCHRGAIEDLNNTDLTTFNRTQNCNRALSILHNAKTIYIIMGCFVNYSYFACVPPKSNEVYEFIKDTYAKKILFYVMGTKDGISPDYKSSKLSSIIHRVEHGNTYRFILKSHPVTSYLQDLINPDYSLLDRVSSSEVPIVSQLQNPIIAEIECGTGCNTPFCTFCIESVRAPKVIYREPSSIIKQVKSLYNMGVRHFRLGRQPNFFHYHKQNPSQVEKLLAGIRESCPELKMLHIDNVNIINVTNRRGKEIAKLVAQYCTSGNITPFGIESFDDRVRKTTGVVGSAEQVLEAIKTINMVGQERGSDGLPRLLPGINLIYNLPGQTMDTHQINIEYLERILSRGWMSRRLYFRYMTQSTGVSFSDYPHSTEEYDKWFQDIVEKYVLPMQERVYPAGIIIKDHLEAIWKNGNTYLRTLGSCPIRVKVKDKRLQPYEPHDIRITGTLGYRLLAGEIVN